MNEKAYEEILDRDGSVKFVTDNYEDVLTLLQEIVDYGTHLIVRCYSESEMNEIDIVILLHFLKQGVALLDAIEIQLRNGAVLTSHILARSLFENFLLTKWIISSDTDRKAHQFFASSLREKRLSASRMIVGNDDHKDFVKVFNRLGNEYSNKSLQQKRKDTEQQIRAIDRILSDSKFVRINAEFTKCRGKKPYEPAWYSIPSCKVSIWNIAEDLGMQGEYKVLYSDLSTVTHNAALSKHVSFENGKVVFEPIRSPNDFGTILSLAISYTISLYKLILEKYRPSEVENFRRKYSDDWKDRYISIKNPVVNSSYRDIVI